jgi:AraC-like DNA-binding protein
MADIRWLFGDVPRVVSIVEQCLLRALLGQLLSRLIRSHRVDSYGDVARALSGFTSAGFSSGCWQDEFRRLLDQCDIALRAETISRIQHVQVERALCAIQERYADPLLNLEQVAQEVALSAPHIARLIKLHTGLGFLTHLHRRRSTAAHRLLIETRLTVKEIAAAVGYRSVTQLNRHFKRYIDATPASVRSMATHTQTRSR